MEKYIIKHVEKHSIELYEVQASSKEEALDKYCSKLAGSLEPVDCVYDPDASDIIEVVE